MPNMINADALLTRLNADIERHERNLHRMTEQLRELFCEACEDVELLNMEHASQLLLSAKSLRSRLHEARAVAKTVRNAKKGV